MKSFGEYIRDLRLANELPLRKVAAYLDIDTSLLSKIERGEKEIDHTLIKKISEYYSTDEKYLDKLYLSEKIADLIYLEDNIEEILNYAKQLSEYLRSTKTVQSQILFKNEH